jgi:hypothetical protein
MQKYGRARQARDVSIAKAWITMVTDMHSEDVILVAFHWQQWFHECASMYYVQRNPNTPTDVSVRLGTRLKIPSPY